jgi:two-component system phosphate regulon sensor histidine kinase PhoR
MISIYNPKYFKTKYLIYVCTIANLLGYVLLYFVIISIFKVKFNIAFFSAFFILIAVISYIFFRLILKIFIYDNIKVIYKTIHNLKIPFDQKNRDIDFNNDIFRKVQDDVKNWATNYEKEIAGLKKLELYRKEFLTNVSHELKTPIFNIQGYISSLIDGGIDDEKVNRNYLIKADKNVERLINIVDDLEIISQLETGELKLEYSRFDIINLVKEVYEFYEEKAKTKKIQLLYQKGISLNSPLMVFADKERIRQVLNNLVDNSIKYGKENGYTKVSFYDMDENILIEISDNGIGIDPVHFSRLFERFYRVDKSRSRELGGSGLGLAIVKHIIESHAQTVNVRSAPNVGSTFSFTLKKV